MLDDEMREGIRQAAEHASSLLSDQKKDSVAQAAWSLIDTLRDIGCSDEHAAEAGYLVAAVLATMGTVPLMYLNEMRENSMDAYVFAAGSLAGVYILPERKGDAEPAEDAQSPGEPPPFDWDAPSRGSGPYL